MSPPLTREADLLDQKLQRLGGQAVGAGLASLGLAGVGAWLFWAGASLPAVALVPPVGLILAGAAVVVWSRGIDVLPDPELPTHAELPEDDPRVVEPLSVRRARWLWAASAWTLWMTTCAVGTWFSNGLAPGTVRVALFLALTLPFTAIGARWIERANGESGFPAR